MENDCIAGINQKLIRAEKHFTEVLSILKPYSKGQCELIPERDEKINTLVLRISLRPKGSPMLSAVVGDFLFAIRCVLDHLVCGIVQKAGVAPVTKQHMFPITASRSNFVKDAKRRLIGVPVNAQAIIERLQPYNAGNEPLRWLDCLHNTDKHRTLNVTVVASSHTAFGWGAGEFQMILGAEELCDGAILPVGLSLDNPASKDLINQLNEMKVEGECALFVAFKELAADSSRDLELFGVAPVLNRILEFVRFSVLPDLDSFLDWEP